MLTDIFFYIGILLVGELDYETGVFCYLVVDHLGCGGERDHDFVLEIEDCWFGCCGDEVVPFNKLRRSNQIILRFLQRLQPFNTITIKDLNQSIPLHDPFILLLL